MKLFPILSLTFSKDERAVEAAGYGSLRSIPWEMIAPHEKQALQNHDQTLKTLASRGGLSACEAIAVFEDRPFARMDLIESYRRLDALVRAFHAERAA